MPENWEMSEIEGELLNICLSWVSRKIEAKEGFSALLVSAHSNGNRMSKYTFDSVEKSLIKCKEELRGELSDANAYALVFDARMEQNGEIQPIFILQCEHRQSIQAMRFGQFYKVEANAVNLNGQARLVSAQ